MPAPRTSGEPARLVGAEPHAVLDGDQVRLISGDEVDPALELAPVPLASLRCPR